MNQDDPAYILSKLAPEFKESQRGWVSGAAENDGSEVSSEEDGHET